MRKRVLALLAVALLAAGSAAALPRRRGPVRYETVNSVTLAWTNSTMTCGLFRLGTMTGGRLWYDENDACPGPVAAQATVTENGPAPFAFQVTVTDDAAPNTVGRVTLSAMDSSSAFITLHLALSVDGHPYTPGTSIYPLSGMTARVRITPSIWSSSSAGCYNYGSSSTPPNQQSCGHAVVAATPGAAANATGQHEGYYQGSALLVAYL